VDNRIIDLTDYLRRREEREESSSRSTFAVWGGDGERSRFALPLWRAAYLVRGSRAALAWQPVGAVEEPLHPLIVLDLAREPARTNMPGHMVEGVRDAQEAPAVDEGDGTRYTIFLGERSERRWYLVVSDLEEGWVPLDGGAREDILFVAGECAGLLFDRDLGMLDDPEV
jgi:hypothetical protein